MGVKRGYKGTPAGVIPEDWRTVDLSHFCTLQRGFDITEATRVAGTVPVYSSSGISYYHNRAMVLPPGVVTGRKGILGKVFLVDEPFWPHDTTLWVKDFRGNHPAYVALILQNFHLERLDAATSVPTLNRNNLAGHKIAVPPTRAEQEAIADALSDAGALIESIEHLLAKKRQIKQGTLQELLTGRKRLPGFEIKPGHKQTEVGVVPQDWEVASLAELLEFRNGVNADKKAYGSGTPFINVLEIITLSHLRASDIPGSVSLSRSSRDTYSVRRGDLVFNRTSETQNEIGLVSVFLDDEPVVFGGFVIRGRRVAGAPLNAEYAGYAFRAPLLRQQIVARGQGAIRANIGQADLRAMLVPLPPLPEQCSIAAILSDIDAEMAALEAKLTKARQIKQGMMQELLTGRIRLV